jgi:hypothetical protein
MYHLGSSFSNRVLPATTRLVVPSETEVFHEINIINIIINIINIINIMIGKQVLANALRRLRTSRLPMGSNAVVVFVASLLIPGIF